MAGSGEFVAGVFVLGTLVVGPGETTGACVAGDRVRSGGLVLVAASGGLVEGSSCAFTGRRNILLGTKDGAALSSFVGTAEAAMVGV